MARLAAEPVREAAPDGVAGRVVAWARSQAERRPLVAARVRTGWVVWTWLSLACYLLGLVLVPSLRQGLRPWLWCWWILVVWFLLARTKTLTWRSLALTFSGACLLAPLIGVVELLVARVMGADVNARDGAVLIAGMVEEPLKLLPLLLVPVVAGRRRARRLAVADYLLLGLAAGLGFQAVEDAIRRLALSVHPQGLFGLLGVLFGANPNDPHGGYPQYGFGLLPGWSDQGGRAFFAGHGVLTALVAAGIGLAVRGRRRFGARAWLLPLALLGMAMVDHAMYNASGQASGSGGPHDLRVPGWLLHAWRLWGHGLLERPLLVALLLVALLADVRRLRRAWPLLPPLPVVLWTRRPARWAAGAAARLVRDLPNDAAPVFRRCAQSAAGTLATAGQAASFVLHELALLAVSATGGRAAPDTGAGPQAVPEAGREAQPAARPEARLPQAGPPIGGESAAPPAGQRWSRTIAYLRQRRELGQHLGRVVEQAAQGQEPPGPAPAAAVAAGALLAGSLCVLALVVLVAAGVAGVHPVPEGAAFLANLFGDLAQWWNHLPLWQQVVVTVVGAALLTFGGMEFLPALGVGSAATDVADHGRGLSDFLRNPREAARRFFTALTWSQVAGYGLEFGVVRLLPAGVGGKGGALLRRELDDTLTATAARDFLQRRADGLARATSLLGKPPRNAAYAGFSRRLAGDLGRKYPAGVRFNFGGFPDFRPYAIKRVQLDGLTGTAADFRRADTAANLVRRPPGYTWHHVEDGRTLLLVPTDLHRAVGHTGGARIIALLNNLSEAERRDWLAWVQGELP